MAILRKFRCYRFMERPYTRKSKFRKKAFIKSVPTHNITRFDMGDRTKKFEFGLELVSKDNVQIRHNAIESARQIVNRHLHEGLGNNYTFKITAYPHHILRENKMLGGAHADRLQSGMAHSFGKTVSVAAQIKKGKSIFLVRCEKKDEAVAKKALKKSFSRFPCSLSIVPQDLGRAN